MTQVHHDSTKCTQTPQGNSWPAIIRQLKGQRCNVCPHHATYALSLVRLSLLSFENSTPISPVGTFTTVLTYHWALHRAEDVSQNHKEEIMAAGEEEAQSFLSTQFSKYHYARCQQERLQNTVHQSLPSATWHWWKSCKIVFFFFFFDFRTIFIWIIFQTHRKNWY